MAGTQAREGKVYLCAVKDVYSGRIVGYAISDRMKARLRSRPWILPSRGVDVAAMT